MHTEAVAPEQQLDFNLYRQRVYVVFLDNKIPIWTPLLKAGLWLYQGSRARFTHVSICVATSPDVLVWIELDFFQSDIVVSHSEVVKVAHDPNENLLSILQDHHNGEPAVLNAIDVTNLTSVASMQNRIYIAQGFDCNINPFTLAKHLIPNLGHNTWTCTGLTEYLIGLNAICDTLNTPFSPDELYDALLNND